MTGGTQRLREDMIHAFDIFNPGIIHLFFHFLGFGEVQPQSLVGLGFKDIIAYGQKHYKVQWMDP